MKSNLFSSSNQFFVLERVCAEKQIKPVSCSGEIIEIKLLWCSFLITDRRFLRNQMQAADRNSVRQCKQSQISFICVAQRHRLQLGLRALTAEYKLNPLTSFPHSSVFLPGPPWSLMCLWNSRSVSFVLWFNPPSSFCVILLTNPTTNRLRWNISLLVIVHEDKWASVSVSSVKLNVTQLACDQSWLNILLCFSLLTSIVPLLRLTWSCHRCFTFWHHFYWKTEYKSSFDCRAAGGFDVIGGVWTKPTSSFYSWWLN